jgi:hypothetical protein
MPPTVRHTASAGDLPPLLMVFSIARGEIHRARIESLTARFRRHWVRPERRLTTLAHANTAEMAFQLFSFT